jgi:hypothetical protein
MVYIYIYLINIITIETKNPIELDLFALEMRCRKMIHELVAPMVEKLS